MHSVSSEAGLGITVLQSTNPGSWCLTHMKNKCCLTPVGLAEQCPLQVTANVNTYAVVQFFLFLTLGCSPLCGRKSGTLPGEGAGVAQTNKGGTAWAPGSFLDTGNSRLRIPVCLLSARFGGTRVYLPSDSSRDKKTASWGLGKYPRSHVTNSTTGD